MINSYDLRSNPSNVLDAYSLLYPAPSQPYTNRPFPNNLYYAAANAFSNTSKPPTFPIPSNNATFYNPDLSTSWYLNKMGAPYTTGIPAPATQIPTDISPNSYITPMAPTPSTPIPPAKYVQESVAKSPEKTGEIMEEEVQIIEVKENCYNKWCPVKGKPAAKDLKKVTINGSARSLCKKCSTAFENQQFCPFCFEIYVDGANNNDGKDWVLCERKKCGKWVHIDCEEDEIRSLLKDNLDAIEYFCPECRRSHHLSVHPQYNAVSKASPPVSKNMINNMKPIARRGSFFKRKKTSSTKGNNFEREASNIGGKYARMESNTSSRAAANTSAANASRYRLPKVHRMIKTSKKVHTAHLLASPIDGILSNFGVKLQLSENDIMRDLNRLRKMAASSYHSHNTRDRDTHHIYNNKSSSHHNSHHNVKDHAKEEQLDSGVDEEIIVIEDAQVQALSLRNSKTDLEHAENDSKHHHRDKEQREHKDDHKHHKDNHKESHKDHKEKEHKDPHHQNEKEERVNTVVPSRVSTRAQQRGKL